MGVFRAQPEFQIHKHFHQTSGYVCSLFLCMSMCVCLCVRQGESERERERNGGFVSGPTWHSPRCAHTILNWQLWRKPRQTNSAETSHRGYLVHQWKTDTKQILVLIISRGTVFCSIFKNLWQETKYIRGPFITVLFFLHFKVK